MVTWISTRKSQSKGGRGGACVATEGGMGRQGEVRWVSFGEIGEGAREDEPGGSSAAS